MDIMEQAFEIISYGGNAKGLAYEALQEAESGNYDKADELMKESNKDLEKAHNIQTEMLTMEARGEKIDIGILFVHAQDHLMTAIEAKSLISHMIKMWKSVS